MINPSMTPLSLEIKNFVENKIGMDANRGPLGCTSFEYGQKLLAIQEDIIATFQGRISGVLFMSYDHGEYVIKSTLTDEVSCIPGV